jgi:lysophospholipid acyltransferase (LPLAT)-like uncharacterized protein
MAKIQLINGPFNGRRITDLGTVRIPMGIASKIKNGRPAIGAKSGSAIYEPDSNRRRAFWLRNQWDGITVANID